MGLSGHFYIIHVFSIPNLELFPDPLVTRYFRILVSATIPLMDDNRVCASMVQLGLPPPPIFSVVLIVVAVSTSLGILHQEFEAVQARFTSDFVFLHLQRRSLVGSTKVFQRSCLRL